MDGFDELDQLMNKPSKNTTLPKAHLVPPSSSGANQLPSYKQKMAPISGLKATGYAAKQVLNNSGSMEPILAQIKERDYSADRVELGKFS